MDLARPNHCTRQRGRPSLNFSRLGRVCDPRAWIAGHCHLGGIHLLLLGAAAARSPHETGPGRHLRVPVLRYLLLLHHHLLRHHVILCCIVLLLLVVEFRLLLLHLIGIDILLHLLLLHVVAPVVLSRVALVAPARTYHLPETSGLLRVRHHLVLQHILLVLGHLLLLHL